MAIIKGPEHKIISTPFGVIGFGPFGQANVDEKTRDWLKKRVEEGRLSGIYFGDEGKKGPEPPPETPVETGQADEDGQKDEAKKKRGKKKGK